MKIQGMDENDKLARVNEVIELLSKLAAEDNVTTDEWLKQAIIKAHQNRHMQWSPKEQKFIEVKCGNPRCWITHSRLPAGYGD